ncbi:MAG: ATP-grasp domain-containing protein [Eubacterium sp.]|nr:ATP-grasp domain-containing protein [Eubacterium sp.]
MSGLLIYSRFEAERNAFSVEQYKKHLDISLMLEEEIDFSGPADFVINRTNNYGIAEEFEKRGIRVFNPSSLTRLANDKQKCYEFMRDNGIEILPVDYKTPPLVMKPIDGKGGKDVILIKDGVPPEKGGYVYQKPATDLGKDLRVWLIGGKIIAAVLRESKTDFRANFCLGGSATPYTLSKDETALIDKISGLLEYDYIGIDFLFNNGKIIFNEIEDSVGARMLYNLTNIDIIEKYCKYIKSTL